MKKLPPTPPGKTRTRQHVLADLGVNYLERHVLLAGYTLERVRFDYGYDLVMWTFDARGAIESGITYFQVKATDHLRLHKSGQAILFPISRRDLRLWLRDTPPVILIVYDGAKDRFKEKYNTMPESRIPYSQLRQLLLELDFTEIVVPESHVAFRHEPSDTLIMLPVYKGNEPVVPRHYAPVRTLLDARGLLDGAEFDRLLRSGPVKQSAIG